MWLSAVLLVRGLRRFFPRRLPYLYRQGLANLYRPANQTLMVVLALGFGAFLLSTLLLVQHNLLRELRVDRGASRPNVVFFDVQPDQRDDVLARVRAEGPLTAPSCRSSPCGIQSLKGRPASELLAIEDEKQRPERWALRREYRSSYRDAPAASERILAGAWWRAGEWKGRAGAGAGAGRRGGGPRARAQGGRSATRSSGTSRACRSPRASRSCARWSGRASSPTSSSCSPRARSTPPRRATCCSRAWTTPPGARTLQRAVVEAHPNVSTLDLAQVQRAIEGVLDKVVLAIRFMALFSLAAGAVVLAGAVAASRYQRVREGALLRTLGARRSQLLRILLAEYAVLGALAAGAAILLSTARGLGARALRVRRLLRAARARSSSPSSSVLGLTIVVGLSAAPRSGAARRSRCSGE